MNFRGSSPILIALACVLLNCAPAHAQVVLDKSFSRGGPVNGTPKLITPQMGRQVGGNLFHSFRTFDLAADESVIFTGGNAPSIVRSRPVAEPTAMLS